MMAISVGLQTSDLLLLEAKHSFVTSFVASRLGLQGLLVVTLVVQTCAFGPPRRAPKKLGCFANDLESSMCLETSWKCGTATLLLI